MMDGATAQSMRDKGLKYHLNWGATLPQLREKADELGANYDLAQALWKENVRECKILATMLMPPDEMLPDVADIWLDQAETLEMAEQLAFNLFSRLPYAADKAFAWIASDEEYRQLCGFHVLSRLFMQKMEPNERGIHEFIDQALCALTGSTPRVKKAAMQSVIRFAELGLVYERIAKSALKQHNLDFL